MPEKVSKAKLPTDSPNSRKKVAERVTKRMGKPRDGKPSRAVPVLLPFESTLAFAFRSCGGKETAINGARLVEDQRFEKIVWAFDNASPADQKSVVLEDLCKAADVSPDEFMGAVMSAMWKRSVDIGKLTAMVAHPQIVEATIQAAQGPFGMPDRKMLLDHAGFLPKATGQTINVGVDARTAVSVVTETKGLPSFEEEGKVLNSSMRKQMKALEAGEPPITLPKVMEAEFVDVPSK